MAAAPLPEPAAASRMLLRNVGLTLFALLILTYWGIGYHFGAAYSPGATEQQRLHTLVEYLWELPAIGVPLAVIVPLLLLRPIARDYEAMLRGERLPDPALSAKRLLSYPRRIVWYFTPASILAYLIGNLQSYHFAQLPLEEFVKGVPLGLPLGLLFSLSSYVALVHFLDPVRRAFVRRHGYAHVPPPRVSIQRKVMLTSITVVGLSLALLWLIAIGQGQAMLEEQLGDRVQSRAAREAEALDLADPEAVARLEEASVGERGYGFLVDEQGLLLTPHPTGASVLAEEGWDPALGDAILGGATGTFTDRLGSVRLVGYAPVPGTAHHVVIVAYRDDFIAPLAEMSWAMLGTTLLAMAIAIGLTLTGSRSVARPLRELTEAMRGARADGKAGHTDLLTDDEVGALAASYASMLDRLRTQHEALERGVAKLREVDAVRTRFLNIASHELRTPMTPLRTELHLLRAGKRGPVTPEMERSLQMLSRNAERLHRLIKELLEASRMQAGQLRLKRAPVPLDELVGAAVRTMEGEAESKGVALDVQTQPARVLADADRVAQVLINLLENAIQFTPRGGRVRVEMRTGPAEAEVRVADTGAGIDPEALPKLFQPFSQAEQGVPRTEGGTGLGLYICKGIVEGHGGRITGHSEGRDKGATFAFTLPLAEPAANEDLPPSLPAAQERPTPAT